MSTTLTIDMDAPTEIRLLEFCEQGDRAAFEPLVTRYQGLICSLAYSACGNRARSEDLAQETFVAAWQTLKSLRDRSKFKSWLCGIARNLIHQSIRQQGRDPVAAADSLDGATEYASTAPSPVDEVIRAEEESLVWLSLERIPENYREPLVLFYREDQSIHRVAEGLELSPDAVKQRLSRGRKMLRQEVLKQVESVLGNTRPTDDFRAGVLMALPLVAPKTAAVGAVGAVTKGVLAAKASGTGFVGVLVAPVIQLLIAGQGVKMQLDGAHSARERRFVIRMLLVGLGMLILYCGAIFGADRLGFHFLSTSPFGPALLMMAFLCVWIPLSWWAGRRIRQMRIEGGSWVEAQSVTGEAAGALSKAGLVARFAGGTFVAAAWLGAFAISIHDWGGLAILALASGLAFTVGATVSLRRPETDFKAMGFSVGATGLISILVIGRRLGLWTGAPVTTALTGGWFLAAVNATSISVLALNLLAWKRDDAMRKGGAGGPSGSSRG